MLIFDEVIKHKEIYNLNGNKTCRTAVRAICFHDKKLLMVHSKQLCDFKFPGGGVKRRESHEKALVREIREETGYFVRFVGNLIGKVREYDISKEKDSSVFESISYYYQVVLSKFYTEQQLEHYEQELGFTPIWISVEQA
ncbi:MAG: NUDIX domain-containing protein, partial [Candidatus Cloacimonetes bacterium]|nr:NUDIX domain-containing protein [Candidatus Cloacimonadota bacterium]